MPEFKVHSEFEMMGDQPQAVEKIAESIESGNRFPDSAWRYWIWQDLYDGKDYREGAETDTDNFAQ